MTVRCAVRRIINMEGTLHHDFFFLDSVDVFFFFSSSDSSIDMCINSLYVNLDLVCCANCGKVIRETDLLCKSFLKHYISGNLDSY